MSMPPKPLFLNLDPIILDFESAEVLNVIQETYKLIFVFAKSRNNKIRNIGKDACQEILEIRLIKS